MTIDDIIRNSIEPLKKDECRKLGLPEGYVRRICGERHKEFEAGSVEPVYENRKLSDKVAGVEIRISEEEKEKSAQFDFFYLIKTAQQYFKNGFREVHDNPCYYGAGAWGYAFRRSVENKIKSALKRN